MTQKQVSAVTDRPARRAASARIVLWTEMDDQCAKLTVDRRKFAAAGPAARRYRSGLEDFLCGDKAKNMSVSCRSAKVLENRITADEERIKQLEKELEMAIVFGEEADRKYEEVSTHVRVDCYNFL